MSDKVPDLSVDDRGQKNSLSAGTEQAIVVEPAGFEPASKHMPNKLSTCVFWN